LLSSSEIAKLRTTFYEGFDKNLTIREIKNTLNKRIKFKNRYRMKNGIMVTKDGQPILSIAAANRAINIARTETVRLCNLGAIKNYKSNNIQKVVWTAAMSDRTCPECADLDGQIMPVDTDTAPPLHAMCFIDYQIPIYTSKGWKEIGKINIGDLVLTHNGKFKKVIKLLSNQKYKGKVIKLKYGWESQKNHIRTEFLTMTPEHPVLTERGWVKVADIKKDDKLIFLAKKCIECGQLFPYFKYKEHVDFCCSSCANKYTARIQFKDDYQHKVRSEKAILQMKRENRKDNWPKEKLFKLTINAHKKTKEMWSAGTHPLVSYYKNHDVWNKGLTKDTHLSIKKISEQRKGKNNPIHKMTLETKRIRREKYMKWLIENPDKHPNRIMAQKGFISKPQKEMYYTILEHYDDAELEYPIRTKSGLKFIDVAIPSKKIAFEFNGKYWHKDYNKDLIRQQAIVNEGWVVLSFNEDSIKDVGKELLRILKNHNNEYQFMSLPIININEWELKTARKLYNFGVEDDESYIAKGMVTHNCRCVLSPYIK